MTEPDITISQKFKNFFKMVNTRKEAEKAIIEPTPEEVQEKLKQQAMLKIQMLFDQAIQDHDAEKIEIILSRNFTMNYNQFVALCLNQADKYERLDSKIINSALYAKYNNEVKYEIDEKLMQAINSPDPLIKNGNFVHFARQVKKIWEFVGKEKELRDKDYALEFREMAVKLSDRLPSFSYGGDNLTDNFNATLKSLIRDVEERYKQHYDAVAKEARQAKMKEFNDTLNEYAIGFDNFDTIKNHIRTSLRENVKKLDSFELPASAKHIVTEITHIANEILPLTLNQKQQLDFDNVYKKRLPQVLEEYMNISPRYREKLENHNEHPDIILLESLVEIKSKIDEVFDNIQSSNHNKQKVTRQYLKTI